MSVKTELVAVQAGPDCLRVTMRHDPRASYSRSVFPAAWRAAVDNSWRTRLGVSVERFIDWDGSRQHPDNSETVAHTVIEYRASAQ